LATADAIPKLHGGDDEREHEDLRALVGGTLVLRARRKRGVRTAKPW
jgi:hypothetical protein